MNYDFNISNWVAMLLPSLLRKPKLQALLVSLLAPFSQTWENGFLPHKVLSQRRLQCTGQVASLRYTVSLITGIEIDIVDGSFVDVLYLNNASEAYTPIYVVTANETPAQSPLYLQNDSENVAANADYVIQVPDGTSETDKARINSLAAKYNLAIMIYKIEEL